MADVPAEKPKEGWAWYQWAAILAIILGFALLALLVSDMGKGFSEWAGRNNNWAIVVVFVLGIALFCIVIIFLLTMQKISGKRVAPWVETLRISCNNHEYGLGMYGAIFKRIMDTKPELEFLAHHGAWLFNGGRGVFNDIVGEHYILNCWYPANEGDLKVGFVHRLKKYRLSEKEIAILRDPEIGIQEAINRLDQFNAVIEKQELRGG